MMKRPDYIPADYKRIKVVSSLSDLFNEQFGGPDEVNCVLFPRRLRGDFNKLSRALLKDKTGAGTGVPFSGIHVFMAQDLLKLKSRASFYRVHKSAINSIIKDMSDLSRRGFYPVLRFEPPRSRPENSVYVFHHDAGARDGTGRVFCCYNDPVTQGIRNEDAVPAESLFYKLKPRTKKFQFRACDIWRHDTCLNIKCDPEKENPFIHRGVDAPAGAPPRLLLLAERSIS